jgi:hypothetical protein
LCVCICTYCGVTVAAEASIDVLWYSYAHDTSDYKRGVERIAGGARKLTAEEGPEWNLSWFGPGSAAPDFSEYDVLVIHSAEPGRTGPAGSEDRMVPDYSGILGNKTAIESARGSRTFLSGSDADLHAVRGDTGHTRIFVPDYKAWDGASGHVVNAVNWAASGSGLGIVAWYHGEGGPQGYWWAHEDSFLKSEVEGYITDFAKDMPGEGRRENTPVVSAVVSRDPLNRGLSTQGLSNWQWSFHGGFDRSIPGYRGIIESAKYPGLFLAVAKERPSAAMALLAGSLSIFALVIAGWMLARLRARPPER